MQPPFTLEIAFTSGLPSSSGKAMEQAAREGSRDLLGSQGQELLAAKRQQFESRYACSGHCSSAPLDVRERTFYVYQALFFFYARRLWRIVHVNLLIAGASFTRNACPVSILNSVPFG